MFRRFGYHDKGDNERAITSAKLALVWEDAVLHAKQEQDARAPASSHSDTRCLGISAGLRESMLSVWEGSHNGNRPQLKQQGSDTLMQTMYKALSAGSFPVISLRQCVNYLMQNASRLTKRLRSSSSGNLNFQDDDEHRDLQNVEAVEEALQVHHTTLSLCVGILGAVPKVQITERKLENMATQLLKVAKSPQRPSMSDVDEVYVRVQCQVAEWLAEGEAESLGQAVHDAVRDKSLWELPKPKLDPPYEGYSRKQMRAATWGAKQSTKGQYKGFAKTGGKGKGKGKAKKDSYGVAAPWNQQQASSSAGAGALPFPPAPPPLPRQW